MQKMKEFTSHCGRWELLSIIVVYVPTVDPNESGFVTLAGDCYICHLACLL